jgi:hypothetical protein
MKPTVYLRLADLRPAGIRQSTASPFAQLSAGRIATPRLWIEADGRQAGMNDQQHQTAGSSGQRRTG